MVDERTAKTAVPLRGSLQKRREIVPGVPVRAQPHHADRPISMPPLPVEKKGGKIVMPICTLAGIGRLLFFQDPEGNIAGAMQYDPKAD